MLERINCGHKIYVLLFVVDPSRNEATEADSHKLQLVKLVSLDTNVFLLSGLRSFTFILYVAIHIPLCFILTARMNFLSHAKLW